MSRHALLRRLLVLSLGGWGYAVVTASCSPGRLWKFSQHEVRHDAASGASQDAPLGGTGVRVPGPDAIAAPGLDSGDATAAPPPPDAQQDISDPSRAGGPQDGATMPRGPADEGGRPDRRPPEPSSAGAVAKDVVDGASGAIAPEARPSESPPADTAAPDTVDASSDASTPDTPLSGFSCEPGITLSCGASNVGACRFGQRTCDPATGTFGPCLGAIIPGIEACDQIDNDCDGKIDNGPAGSVCGLDELPCIPGSAPPLPCGVSDKAPCRLGRRTCDSATRRYGPCQDVVLPVLEMCNGLDDDCDGRVDNAFNLQTDPNNCGKCGNACTYPNGIGACVGEVCRLVGCAAGRGDANHDATDGCECTVTGSEGCDGIDNDCDGSVDYDLRGTAPKSVCTCTVETLPVSRDNMYQIEPNPPAPRNRCAETTCSLEPDGALTMSYCLAECGGNSSPWAVCLFAGQPSPANLSNFDVDFGANGVLEVVFDVLKGPLAGALRLYYGVDPRRKYVNLIYPNDSLSPGRYVKYFAPGQAVFPSWPAVPEGCRESCGGCPAIKNDPDFVFNSADLLLAAEACTARAEGQIRLMSVSVLSVGCGCNTDGSCSEARPQCRPASSVSPPSGKCAWPTAAPPGMCGLADACKTSVDLDSPCATTGPSCTGIWRCIAGHVACDVSGCVP